MSDNSGLMDTDPGGEQTQYEGSHTFVEPHGKQAGQLGGDPATTTTTNTNTTTSHNAASDAPNTQGVPAADKMRYGQSIQEGGMGGKTTSSTGNATTEGGFGGTKAVSEESEGFAKERREQGYGGGADQSKEVGG